MTQIDSQVYSFWLIHFLLQIKERIQKKKEEIKSLTKPDPVSKPTPSDTVKEDHEAVETLNSQITAIETQTTELNDELSKVNKKIQKYKRMLEALKRGKQEK